MADAPSNNESIKISPMIIEQAEEFKNQGNVEFKGGNYIKAIEAYNKAIRTIVFFDVFLMVDIDVNGNEPSYYANRAACFLQLKKFHKAIEDCDRALHLNSSNTKVLRRKAKCLLTLGELDVGLYLFYQIV